MPKAKKSLPERPAFNSQNHAYFSYIIMPYSWLLSVKEIDKEKFDSLILSVKQDIAYDDHATPENKQYALDYTDYLAYRIPLSM
jgi:hypothetical protein